jgi:hypothetical protein
MVTMGGVITASVAASNGPPALARVSNDRMTIFFFIECVLRKGSLSRPAVIGDHVPAKIAQLAGAGDRQVTNRQQHRRSASRRLICQTGSTKVSREWGSRLGDRGWPAYIALKR